MARFDRIQQFNDDVDPGAFGVLDSPLLAAGHGDGFGEKSGFQVGCPVIWFAPDSNPTDGVDDSFLYLAWDIADVQSLVDAEDLHTPVPFDGDGNGSACFGPSVTPGDNRDERYEVQLRTCADLKQFDPRDRDVDGLLNHFEARLVTGINGLAKEPSQTWLHTEISTPLRALAFRDFGRLHQRISAFPTSDGLAHTGDAHPTNPSDTCIQTELNACRRQVERTCRLSGQPCGVDADCPEIEFCDGKDACDRLRSCFFNNNNVEMVIKRVETSGLFGPHHGRCRKTGRDCRTDARNTRLCPRAGAHDPLCCDVNDPADMCDEIVADGADAKRNRMALAQLDALFRADTDEDAAAEEEAVVASFTSIPGIEVRKTVRCAGQRVCDGTAIECTTNTQCESPRACVDAPFTHETPKVAPGAVLEFEIAISNTGNEDLDVTVRDILEQIDLDPQTVGTQSLSRCDVVCESTCSVSGVACDASHACPASETCVPPIRAFLTSPRRGLLDYEVTAKNAERPPVCTADRTQCLHAAFLAPSCTDGTTTDGFLDSIRLGSSARLGTLLGAGTARTGDVCNFTDGDSIRIRMRVRTALANGVSADEFCVSTPLVGECRNRVSADGRIVEPVLVRSGEALGSCKNDADCDDGLICNGVETCGLTGRCQTGVAGTGICPIPSVCNPLENPCRFPRPGESVAPPPAAATLGQPCMSDSVCDDGVVCNGFERCRSSVCIAGPPVCGTGLKCDERNEQGERFDPCGRVVARDGASDADSSIDIDLLCRDVHLVKEVGFPQCPCSFTSDVSALSLSKRCQGVEALPTNCCCGHNAPGCQDTSCREAVCTARPSCCRDAWNAGCAQLASQTCSLCQATVASSELAADQDSERIAASLHGVATEESFVDEPVAIASGNPFAPLTIQYRLTATNRGEVAESVTLQDDELCRDLKAAASLKPGQLLVASDCAICPPPTLLPSAVGPIHLPPGATTTTTCTVTFRSEAALAAFLQTDTGQCVGGARSGSLCAVSEDCPGGVCLFPSCDGEAPIRSADGDDCYRNCASLTAANDNPWLRPTSLSDTSAATVCFRPCELNVCKQVRCLEDCDVNHPGPWHSERACSQHPEICCQTSADCPGFIPQDPNGAASEQCVDQSPLSVTPGACLQYRVTVTVPPASDASLCAMEITDTMQLGGADGGPFRRVPYDVMVTGRRCEGFTDPPEFNVVGIPKLCKFLPIAPGGVAPLQPGESVAIQFRADLKPASEVSTALIPENRVLVRGQRTDEGCDGNPEGYSFGCTGESKVPFGLGLCDFEVVKDVTCEDPRSDLDLRPGVAYGSGQIPNILPGTRVWFRVDIVNRGGLPLQMFQLREELTNTVGDGCTSAWFVPHSVVASIGGENVTGRICTGPLGDCDEFSDLSGKKDFMTRTIKPGERLVITYAVDQPETEVPFSHRGTQPPAYDCLNSVTVSLLTADLSNVCANGNPCPREIGESAGFNIAVPHVECTKDACLDRNNDGDCSDDGDSAYASSIYLPPPTLSVQSEATFPITVVYRMTAENDPVTPGGSAETRLTTVEVCDSQLAAAIRSVALTCVGGANAGKICHNDADCPGVGSGCGDLRCRGGSSNGIACVQDGECPGGVCGAPDCVGGTKSGMMCRTDGDCPGGTCRSSLEPVPCAFVAAGLVNDCVVIDGLGLGGGEIPPAVASRTCGLRFNREAAWLVFGTSDRMAGGCDGACFENEAVVHATAATGLCEGGTRGGEPCAEPRDCMGGVCRAQLCGVAGAVSSQCGADVCMEPPCAIAVTKEARCLPECSATGLGEDEGWIRDPLLLPTVPGACVEYRVKVCNVSESGIGLCRLEFSDEMLLDGVPDDSSFIGGPLHARVLGRSCQGIDFAQAFNWDGQPVACVLTSPVAPHVPLPLAPGECMYVRFDGRLKDAASIPPIPVGAPPTNQFVARGDGTCAETCTGDRSAGFSCEGADRVSLLLQTCDFNVVDDVGCPENAVAASARVSAGPDSRQERPPLASSGDGDGGAAVAGASAGVEILPGSAPELHVRIDNTGVAPIDRLSIECCPSNTCAPSWFDGAISGTICGPSAGVCSDVTLCTCDGSECQSERGLCKSHMFRLCGSGSGSLVPTELEHGQQMDLFVVMHIPATAPPTAEPVDCVSQFQVRVGTAGCSADEWCRVQCTQSFPVNVLVPSVECEKDICADMDGNGVCDGEFEPILDLGPNPPAPFDLIYRFRLTNTGEVNLKNVVITDRELRLNGAPYIPSAEKCALAADTGSTAPISLAPGMSSDYVTCTLRFPTLADFEAFANLDGRPNNGGEICYTNTAESSAEIDPPDSVCPVDAVVRTGDCSAEVCTRKCSDNHDESCTPTTTVVIDVFNQNESKFSGLSRCIDSWDSRLLSAYVDVGVPNYFWRELLRTDKGMARINGVASNACGKESVAAPLLGVASKLVLFTDDRSRRNVERTGLVPVGLGAQAGTIWYDIRSTNADSPTVAAADPSVEQAVAGLDLGNDTPAGGIGKLGSLLVFPRVEIKWNARGELIQDTFLDIANNSERGVYIQAYLIESDRCGMSGHGFNLTKRQPIFWSAARGDPKYVAPFTSLRDGCRDDDPRNPGGRVLRGYLLLWAVDSTTLREIRWNNLKGDALLLNYAEGSAWEYEAWAFQALAGTSSGTLLRAPFGQLDLDGVEYEAAPDELLLDFYAVGARLGGADTPRRAEIDTDLTLWAVLKDLRGRTSGRP